MPLREPPPLTLSFSMAMPSSSSSSSAREASTILDQCLQLPKLNLGSCSARSSASRPKFLDLIAPLKYPFSERPAWCLNHETFSKPRAITLLDVYKNHEFLTTHTVYQKSMYLIGRNAGMVEIVLSHCSISRLHAAILHHEDGVSVYLVDLGSAHGTFIDGLRLKALQPTLLVHGSQLKFGASSRSYTFKSFDSREQIAEIVKAQVGLEADELALNHNTLLNRAISYRIELSPNMQNDDPMAYPSGTNPHEDQQQENPSHQRRSSTDDLTLSLAAFRHDEPARKRSRGQSGNSQGSSDNSMGDAASHMMVLDSLLDDADEEAQGVLKKVHFTTQPPIEIPHVSPPASPVAATANTWGMAVDSSSSSGAIGALGGAGESVGVAPSQSLRLDLGCLAALTIPTPQGACS